MVLQGLSPVATIGLARFAVLQLLSLASHSSLPVDCDIRCLVQGSCICSSADEMGGTCRALNNVALLDLGTLQRMLGGSDLRVEIFHVMSYLLTLCTRQWGKPGLQVCTTLRLA